MAVLLHLYWRHSQEHRKDFSYEDTFIESLPLAEMPQFMVMMLS